MGQRKTIVVTGGAGFLGSHLCDKLFNPEEQTVVCIDNFLTGSAQNINHLKKYGFELHQRDIINPIFLDCDVDKIYNLACPASPPQYQNNALRTIKTNTLGVINMLGMAKKDHARILQASTSEVYGDPTEHPQKETYRGNVNPIGPRACYDEGKRVAETLFFDYHRMHKVDICIMRIFNTYGPRMAPNDGRVVSNFITQALQDKDITIYGKGTQTRSFCYVTDLLEGMVKLMNSTEVGPINIGNPQEFTMLELAEKVIKYTKSNSKIAYGPLPEDDPRQRKPDITLAKEKLDWEPQVSLDEGLQHTIEYFVKQREAL